MAVSKAKTTKSRRTKAEVQEELESIQEELSQESSYENPKTLGLLQQKEAEIQEAVKDLSVDTILRKFADLSGDISKTFSSLSEKMLAEVTTLSHLRQAVAIETKALANLHKVDIAHTALDQLIEDYNEQKGTFTAEMTLARQAWKEESESKLRETKEAEELLKKTRQREVEEYEYKKNLERKKAEDKYEEAVQARDKKNREMQESLEKSWQLREDALKMREEELSSLRKTVEEFPNRLRQEVQEAVEAAVKQAEQALSQEILLLKRDNEAEQKMAELKIKTLEESVLRQLAYIGTLQTQLEEAKKQVQDIAVKAIEGASGAKALSHINQIAMEQAKTRAGAT